MFAKSLVLAAAVAGTVSAQRPTDESICDYYTGALLENNTAENQYTLLTLLVNTVVIGNYSEVNTGVKVPGILAEGEFNGTKVNLLPYFNGDLESTNRGGNKGVSVNFLDGGGAAPLMENKPANSDKTRQHFLLTHLYQFFGSLLGCSEYSMPGFPAYGGDASMYEVHKFMDLDPSEVGYFIQQVALAAQSFGVADSDIEGVGMALNSLFNVRCAPPTEAIPGDGKQLQSICINEACPVAENSTCQCYDAAVEPGETLPEGDDDKKNGPECEVAKDEGHGGNATMTATSSGAMPTGGAETTGSMPGEPTEVTTPGAAALKGVSVGAALMAGLAAFML